MKQKNKEVSLTRHLLSRCLSNIKASPVSTKDRLLNFPGHLRSHKKVYLFGFIFTLPIIVFFYQYLATPHKIIAGDFDYYSQMYEAARISVLKFHQFPLWNPWLSGGVPLFANPQFGLFSIQFLFALIFGAAYGMKLAYIVYAIVGFWGMHTLARRVLQSSTTRGLLLSYIWVFCGFYAGHNISHYTFASYFLLPWLIYFLARRSHKRSWLWFGIVESVIILSSMHYAFLMTALIVAVYFIVSIITRHFVGDKQKQQSFISRDDIIFAAKALATIVILSGYRLITTYYFVAHNEKSQAILKEPVTHPGVLFQALFFPAGTLTKLPQTTWGWGEYSMYIGMGASIALLVVILSLFRNFRAGLKTMLSASVVVISVIVIALMATAFSVGDFASYSPFHLLHKLPGFTQTRVSARWMIFALFGILVILGSWRKNVRLINILLLLSVLELFITNGPPRMAGQNETTIPPANFATTFSQYDNGKLHPDLYTSLMQSYYYSTARNVGQVYADDSLVDTLHLTRATNRCGINVNAACTFVLSNNAEVSYWSPNKIIIKRTKPGDIQLNMNTEAGWQVNDAYPFAAQKSLDPSLLFVLPAGSQAYTLQYAPKLSPSWLSWRISKL